MKINIIDPTSDKRWDEFIAGQKDSTIFHTTAWARTIREAYNYIPRYYVLENNAGGFAAAMPIYQVKSALTGSRLVCLPFSDTCCPLGSGADLGQLLEQVKKDMGNGKSSYLELRGWPDKLQTANLGLQSHDYHLLYVVEMNDNPAALNKKFHDSVRRGIRQAENRNVTVRLTHDEADLDRFYNLHIITRKKLGVLPQPQAFFKSIYRNMIAKDLGFTGLAECEGQVIAGVVFLYHKDTLYYKFNASDENHLQKRPNHLVTWEAIKYGYSHGYRYLDLGRCSPEEEGLRVYKKRWGAKEINLPYYFYPGVKGVASVTENSARYRVMRTFSHLAPRFAFEAAGALLYRHLG
jgi:predicted N-acyltransferase